MQLEEDLVEYLAQSIRGDIRKLESAIVGLRAKSSLLQRSPDIAMAKEVVAEIIGNSQELSAGGHTMPRRKGIDAPDGLIPTR